MIFYANIRPPSARPKVGSFLGCRRVRRGHVRISIPSISLQRWGSFNGGVSCSLHFPRNRESSQEDVQILYVVRGRRGRRHEIIYGWQRNFSTTTGTALKGRSSVSVLSPACRRHCMERRAPPSASRCCGGSHERCRPLPQSSSAGRSSGESALVTTSHESRWSRVRIKTRKTSKERRRGNRKRRRESV